MIGSTKRETPQKGKQKYLNPKSGILKKGMKKHILKKGIHLILQTVHQLDMRQYSSNHLNPVLRRQKL